MRDRTVIQRSSLSKNRRIRNPVQQRKKDDDDCTWLLLYQVSWKRRSSFLPCESQVVSSLTCQSMFQMGMEGGREIIASLGFSLCRLLRRKKLSAEERTYTNTTLTAGSRERRDMKGIPLFFSFLAWNRITIFIKRGKQTWYRGQRQTDDDNNLIFLDSLFLGCMCFPFLLYSISSDPRSNHGQTE